MAGGSSGSAALAIPLAAARRAGGGCSAAPMKILVAGGDFLGGALLELESPPAGGRELDREDLEVIKTESDVGGHIADADSG